MIPAYETSVELSDAILLDMLTNLDARLEYVDSHAWTTVRCQRLIEEVRRLRRAASEDRRRIGELEERLTAADAENERVRRLWLEGKPLLVSSPGSGV